MSFCTAIRWPYDAPRKLLNLLKQRLGMLNDPGEGFRALGARLADASDARGAENLDFAERFTTEHRETFDRLSQ